MSEHHSPLPWRLVIDDEGAMCQRNQILDAGGKTLMCDEQYYPWCPDSDADWALIVRAVNAHKALVDALKDLVANAVGMPDDPLYAIPCVGDEMSESARDGRRRLIAQWRERAAKIASNSEGMTQLVTLQDFLANRVITFNECADQLEALDALAGEGPEEHGLRQGVTGDRPATDDAVTCDAGEGPAPDYPKTVTGEGASLRAVLAALKARIEGEHDDATHWPKGSERDGHTGECVTECPHADCVLVTTAEALAGTPPASPKKETT